MAVESQFCFQFHFLFIIIIIIIFKEAELRGGNITPCFAAELFPSFSLRVYILLFSFVRA